MNSRIKSLDGLRGILCILVVFHHYDAKYIPQYFFENFIIRQADLLVDFFFIISGFVISYNYKHIATIEEAKLFLKKRFFRLYPLLLYTTTLYFIFEIVSRNAFSSFINKEINNTTIIKSYLDTLFLNNSTPLLGSSWGINRPTWSISAEFYSYVFFSIALIWITPKFRNIIMGLSLIAAAIILFYVSRNGKVSNAEYGYLRCLYLFIGGFFIEKIKVNKDQLPSWLGNLIFFSIIIILYFNKNIIENQMFHNTVEIVCIPFLFSLLLYFTIHTNGLLTKILNTKPIQWLGKYSFSIYLNHALILLVLPKFIFQVLKLEKLTYLEFGIFALCILLILLYSRMTFKFIEEKFYLKRIQ